MEISAPDCRDGNRGSGNRRRGKSMESEGFNNVLLTILTENRVYDTRWFSAPCGFGVQRLTRDKEI